MQRLEVSGAVRPIYGSLGVKGLINLSRTLHKLHSAWLLSFHYTTTISGDVVFSVSDHHVSPKQMSSEFIIKSIALEESVGDDTWQDHGEGNSGRHGSDGNSENGVEVIKCRRSMSRREFHPCSCD